MNIFIFSGHIGKAPELTNHPQTMICRFNLIRNESRGKDDDGNRREQRVVSIPFSAFGARAQLIHDNCYVGDQLTVEARIENSEYEKDGEKRYGYNFIVESLEFGAPGKQKRALLEQRAKEGNGGATLQAGHNDDHPAFGSIDEQYFDLQD